MTRLERKVRVWQRRLRLTDWEITVEYNTDPDWRNYGDIGPIPGRKEAILTLSTHIPADRQDWVIVHEFVHLLIWPMNTVADAWSYSLPAKSRMTHAQQWVEVTEQVVDNLARLYAAEPPRPVE